MGYIKDQRPVTMMVEGEWQVGAYTYKAPHYLPEFVAGLKEKKIIGSLCMGCGKVIVPIRNICGRCHLRMTERQVVSDWGTVRSFVYSAPMEKGKIQIMGVDPVETGVIEEGSVLIPAFVQFDGSDSNIVLGLQNCKPEDVYVGLRVKAVWAEKPAGALSDLEGVEPL